MQPALETVVRVLSDIKRDPALRARIHRNTDLLDEVGLDSLELTEFMLRLEDEMGTELDLENFEFSYLRRVQDLLDFLGR
ncbi:MAG TPA: phosphopantetheine-binding protein [Pseudomonadota bacterium]|nr:phosphopantetheine-binding protein [Pseudomonadota bacterium]